MRKWAWVFKLYLKAKIKAINRPRKEPLKGFNELGPLKHLPQTRKFGQQ
jgi:hypothetical protein